MKKITMIAALIFAALGFAGCSMLGGSSTSTNNASSNVGSGILGSVLGTNSGSSSSVLGTVLSSLLGNTTTANSIVGTWTYSAPKVVFESESVLAQIGSSVASSSIEKKLSSVLNKVGFKAGSSTFVFNSDGTCTLTLSKKTMNGTYTYNSSTNVMTIKGALGVTSISPTVSVTGNQMYMVFDADKLLSMATSLSGSTSNLGTLSNLLSNYNGLKLGWAMTK